MKLPAYPRTRPSGIDGSDDSVPEHWDVKRPIESCLQIALKCTEFVGREVFHYSIPVVQETRNWVRSKIETDSLE